MDFSIAAIAFRSNGEIIRVRGSGTENEASCWIGTGCRSSRRRRAAGARGGATRADAGELVLQDRDRLVHLLGGRLQRGVDRHRTAPWTKVPIGSPDTARRMFPSDPKSNTMIGRSFSMQQADRRGVHDLVPSRSTSRYSIVSNRCAVGSDVRVGGVDAVDLRALQDRLRTDLERALRRGRVGREVRARRSRRRTRRPAPSPGAGSRGAGCTAPRSGPCGSPSATRVGTWIFSSASCKRERVHHRGEHAHVVGAGTVDPRRLAAAEDVAAADDDGALDPEVDHVGELAGQEPRGCRRDAVAGVDRGEGVAGEFEQHTVVERPAGLLRVVPFRHDAYPTRSPRRADTGRTDARRPSPRPWPTSRRGAAGSSSSRPSRTAGRAAPSRRRRSSSLPSTILGITSSGLPSSRACASKMRRSDVEQPPGPPRRG